MIRNFTHFSKDILITYDSRLSEIRLTNKTLQDIRFIKLTPTENNILMFSNDDNFFKKRLRDIIKDNGFLIALSSLSEVKTE